MNLEAQKELLINLLGPMFPMITSRKKRSIEGISAAWAGISKEARNVWIIFLFQEQTNDAIQEENALVRTCKMALKMLESQLTTKVSLSFRSNQLYRSFDGTHFLLFFAIKSDPIEKTQRDVFAPFLATFKGKDQKDFLQPKLRVKAKDSHHDFASITQMLLHCL